MLETPSRVGETAAEGVPVEVLNLVPPPLPCANCTAVLHGPYCSLCGQHVADYHRSLRRLVTDFLDSAIGWDNKLLRTLGPLFLQPGFLTLEFMAGRRARYVHPLRLFLFTSAVCLTLLQFSHNHFDGTSKPHRQHVVIVKAQAGRSPAKAPVVGAATTPTSDDVNAEDETDNDGAKPSATPKATKTGQGGQTPLNGLGDWIDKTVENRMSRNGGENASNAIISQGVQRKLSWMALALLPIFALGLRSIYWRRDSFYFGHLIFSLHYHTFLLLFWTAYTGAELLAPFSPIHWLFELALTLSLLLPGIYLFTALRRAYGESSRRTFAKTFLLGSMHLLIIFAALTIVGASVFFSGSN